MYIVNKVLSLCLIVTLILNSQKKIDDTFWIKLLYDSEIVYRIFNAHYYYLHIQKNLSNSRLNHLAVIITSFIRPS